MVVMMHGNHACTLHNMHVLMLQLILHVLLIISDVLLVVLLGLFCVLSLSSI
jgi:uncharacterized membrane protein